jgi:hypothetical protein
VRLAAPGEHFVDRLTRTQRHRLDVDPLAAGSTMIASVECVGDVVDPLFLFEP